MRRIWQVILLTSAVWFLLDVLLLFYFLNTSQQTQAQRHDAFDVVDGQPVDVVDDGHDERHARPKAKPQEPRTLKRGPKPTPSHHSETTDGNSQDGGDAKEKLEGEDVESEAQIDVLMGEIRGFKPGPGEKGKAVRTDEGEKEEEKEMFKLNQFNLMVSNRIALNRSLPDVRHSACRTKSYDTSSLPGTSIVMVFHNEAWSTLLRSIYSVVNRTPRSLIKEIILIDDFSDREFLKRPLDRYVRRLLVPVTIRHLPKRSGLVQARLTGAKLATGSTLTFLDAHIEVTEGWLEPLVSRIGEDRKVVICPVIDVISDDTFEYVTASDTTWGGFNWKLQFRWYNSKRGNGDRAAPIKTPTMAGGLFTIDREYFWEVGSYDEGMEVWGGENLEMSFRVWTCGGQIEISPCSHVGHVFRKQTPYTFPGGTANVIHHNALRTAAVWMDEYKEFYYKIMPGVKNQDPGDLSSRQQLRKDIGCHSFRWYLENVYTEAHIPSQFYALGYVRNAPTDACLDTGGRKAGEKAMLIKCHKLGGNQPRATTHSAWSYTELRELRADELCLSGGGFQAGLKLTRCDKKQKDQAFDFSQETGQIVHSSSDLCVTAGNSEPKLERCDPINVKQMWVLEDYTAELKGGPLF